MNREAYEIKYGVNGEGVVLKEGEIIYYFQISGKENNYEHHISVDGNNFNYYKNCYQYNHNFSFACKLSDKYFLIKTKDGLFRICDYKLMYYSEEAFDYMLRDGMLYLFFRANLIYAGKRVYINDKSNWKQHYVIKVFSFKEEVKLCRVDFEKNVISVYSYESGQKERRNIYVLEEEIKRYDIKYLYYSDLENLILKISTSTSVDFKFFIREMLEKQYEAYLQSYEYKNKQLKIHEEQKRLYKKEKDKEQMGCLLIVFVLMLILIILTCFDLIN